MCFTQAGADLRVIQGDIAQKNPAFFQGGLTHHALSQPEPSPAFFAIGTGVTGQERQLRIRSGTIHYIKDSLLGRDQWRQFREDQLAHGHEIALALEHPGESRQVGF